MRRSLCWKGRFFGCLCGTKDFPDTRGHIETRPVFGSEIDQKIKIVGI